MNEVIGYLPHDNSDGDDGESMDTAVSIVDDRIEIQFYVSYEDDEEDFTEEVVIMTFTAHEALALSQMLKEAGVRLQK